MHTFIKKLFLVAAIAAPLLSIAQANTVTVSGNILHIDNGAGYGTTFDRWNINMLNTGSFKVNVLAFESTSNSAADAIDINSDGELTYLDPDTYFYKNTGNPLLEADFLARCDDINNNCNTIDTATIKLSSLDQAEGAADGSIHNRRDPAFSVTLAVGEYLYLIADYRLKPAEAETGFDLGNTIRNGGDHADYQIMFSSDTLHFDVSGTTINVSAVPVPAAVWLFSSALVGLFARRKIAA